MAEDVYLVAATACAFVAEVEPEMPSVFDSKSEVRVAVVLWFDSVWVTGSVGVMVAV